MDADFPCGYQRITLNIKVRRQEWRCARIPDGSSRRERMSSAGLIRATNGGALFLSGGSRPVVAQDCSGAIGQQLGGRSDNHHGSAFLHVSGVKFLLADVIRLLAGS